jgi:hypothetical protein
VAKFGALAAGPVGFTDELGSQLSIPTALIYFEDGNAAFTAPATMSATASDAIGKWLVVLAKEGFLVADTTSPTAAAMVIEAKDPGSAGNGIQVEITNLRPKPTDASKKIVDAAVSETDEWRLLTPATLKQVVGTSATTGDQRGLVFVSSGGAPVQPQDGVYALTGDPATVVINKADATAGAFTVKAKAAGPDGALTTVTIEGAADAANPDTFSMTAKWTKAAPALEAAGIEPAFAYEISVDPPDGGTLAIPAPGSYPLSGGAAAQGATKATVTVPAGA